MLQNREYWRFANENAVDVLAMEEMDRAEREKSPLVATYKAKDEYGDEQEYLAEFAGLTVEQGYQAARSVGMDLLAVMRAELGSLDRVKRVVKVLGMVNAVPEFTDHPKVINGCSDLFVEVLGDAGKHARSAVGMGSLPMGIPVEIECIVEVS